MARSAKYGLIVSLVCCCLAMCLPVLAQPVPHVTLDVPGEVLIGEDFTFIVTFDNDTGTIGYGPFIDLVLESGGADLNSAGGPGDGITFVSARMVAVNPPAPALTSTVTPANWSASSCQYLGPLPHPYPEVVQGIVPPNPNPVQVAPVVIAPLVGAQLVTIELPFGSFDPSQPAIVVEVTVRVHEFADADPAIQTPLEIRARGGFRYGEDALNIPVPDYPILSHDLDSDQWVKTTVNPVVFTLKKEYLGPEDEAVAGPNFTSYYPLTYRITVDVADLQKIKYLQVTDDLPGNLQYADNLKVWIDGVDVALSLYPAGTPVCTNVPPNPPSFPVAFSEPLTGTQGGTVQVTTCQLITGHQGLPYEVVIEFDFYIPDGVLDARCDPYLCPVLLTNDVIATGDWKPFDPRDPVAFIVSDVTPADHVLQGKCIAVQKYVTPIGVGLVPGGMLRYELRFQISDYHSIGGIKILDQLSDGQRLLPTPTPVLTIQDQLDSYSTVVFPAEMLNPAVDCACCCCAAVGAVSGVTDLVFDVSGALVAADAASLPLVPRHQAGILTGGYATLPTSATAAYGSIVFYVEIADEFFVNGANGQSPADRYVDKDDPINNCVRVDGEVYHNKDNANDVPTDVIGSANDKSFTCVILRSGVLEKSVYAVKRGINYICGPGNCGTPDVLPGDDVTFRIQYTIPSGDAESLTIRDWLPLPVFSVNDPMNTGGSQFTFSAVPCPGSLQPPATGFVACGPDHSPFQFGPLVTWFPPPTFSVMPGSNSLKFAYDSPWDTLNTAKTIDLLFTLTVTHEPFADGLYLTNETQECELNTFGFQFCQTAIAQVHVREPELSIKKGVIATNNPHGEYGVYDPGSGFFTSGSAPTPTTATPPSSCTPVPLPLTSFPITSSNLASFINRDLRGVDADDWVTFAIAIENTGGAPAYEIELVDTPPSILGQKPCCFVPCFGAGLITVTNGAGMPIPIQPPVVSSGHVTIELDAPLAPWDPSSGTNIAIITFNAKLLDAHHLQSGCCSNKVELIRYTSAADTSSVTWPNFVTAGFGGPFEDLAWVCVSPSARAKCIEATSEPHTAPETAGSMPGVTAPNALNTVDAAIGEIVRFRLVTVIPEGTTVGLQITDLLPVGLTYVGNPSLVFVTDMWPVTSTPVFPWCTIVGDQKGYGGCPGDPIPACAPDVAVSPFAFGTGQDPIFFVKSPTAPAPYFNIQNFESNDTNLELAIIEFNAQVDNIQSNQDGTMLANEFEVTWNKGTCCSNQAPSRSDPVYVRVVEPVLTLMKFASPTSTQPNGTVSYSVTATNTGTADAFDVHFRDTLPTDLTLVTSSISVPWGCTYTTSTLPDRIDVDCPCLNSQTSFMPITYQATVSSAVQPCPKVLTNTATVTWTSLPGPNGTLVNPTGQSTVGPSGAATPPNNVVNGERNGSSGYAPFPASSPPLPNDYFDTASVPVTVECCPCVHPLPPKMAAWWPLDETLGNTVYELIAHYNGTLSASIGPGGPVSSTSSSWPSCIPVGKVGNSLYFITGQGATVLHNSQLDPSGGPFTVDAWVAYCPLGSGDVIPIVSKGNPSPGNYGWQLGVRDLPSALGRLRLDVYALSGGSYEVNITPNTWHHVAATLERGVSSDTVKLYVDGIPQIWTVAIGTIGASIASTSNLLIGPLAAHGQIAIDEVEIFHYALTQAEVQGIFGAGTAGKCKPDLGDAPDSTNHASTFMQAYPVPVVQANFPTVYAGSAPLGPIHWDAKGLAWLGAAVSIEEEADAGWDQDGTTNIQPALGIDGNDAFNDGVTAVALANCAQTSFTFSATAVAATQVYINVWFDWTRDGDWDDMPRCALDPVTTGLAPEWAVQNYLIALSPGFNAWPANPAMMTPAFWSISPPPGQTVWMRITLTDVPVSAANSDGSGPVGGYCYGETEDYRIGPCGIVRGSIVAHDVYTSSVPYLQTTGDVRIEECVTRDTDAAGNVTDTYTYIVTNVSVYNNGCGLCAFQVPNPGLIGSMQNDQGWGNTMSSAWWLWRAALSPNCQSNPAYNGIQVGQSGRFWFSVPGPTTDTHVWAYGMLCDSQNPSPDLRLWTTGPGLPSGCVHAPGGMVSWWPGDGNTSDIMDSNPGTLLGSAGYAPGVVGQAFRFVAAGDGVSVSNAANLNFGGGDLSIDAWIVTSSTAGVLPIVDKRSGASGSQATGYTLFLFGGRLAFQLGDGTFFNYISASMWSDLRDGLPHHVAVTVDKTSTTGGNLYVDGVVVLNFNPTNRPGSLTNGEPLFIGRHAGTPTTSFIGLIDEVEIFSRELTAGEVLGIFTAGTAGKCK